MEEHERIRISGVINDVTFANPENGFTVLELESGDELITAVGVMPELKAGELLELSGYWDFHASFGRQFVECLHEGPDYMGRRGEAPFAVTFLHGLPLVVEVERERACYAFALLQERTACQDESESGNALDAFVGRTNHEVDA